MKAVMRKHGAAIYRALLVACVLPAMVATVTETICWISMGLEAASIGLGVVAIWIKKHALQ